MNVLKKGLFFTVIFYLSAGTLLQGQVTKEYIDELKDDKRGPYRDIKWFCEDGTIRAAKDPCPESMEGVQHARYKSKVLDMAKRHHIFLDQILTGTVNKDFWDAEDLHSRAKQYQLTNYLFNADDGWILKKARYYRGAKQIEDEKEWGQNFLEWVVDNDRRLSENYLLIRLLARDIPHGEDSGHAQRVRAYSKVLGDQYEDFMETRIKMHNNPSASDIDEVLAYKKKHYEQLSRTEQKYMDDMLVDMRILYKPFSVEDIKSYIKGISPKNKLRKRIEAYTNTINDYGDYAQITKSIQLLNTIKEQITAVNGKENRVKLIDLSNKLEQQIIQKLDKVDESNFNDIREKVCYLKDAIYAGGYIAQWEYNKISRDLSLLQGDQISLYDIEFYKNAAQKLVLWSTEMIQSMYAPEVNSFLDFESLASGLTDDIVRSTVILPMGQLVERLNAYYNKKLKNASSIMGKKNQSGVIGLNPGLAKGKLVVIPKITSDMEIRNDHIYAFDRPPADLKPVAGILNVKEGNPVSHVQLLARNLGIPNGLISSSILNDLKKYDGKEVVYAVSPKGTINLKLAEDMTSEEQKLFAKKQRSNQRIKISTDQLILHPDSILDMSRIGSEVSGKWSGPKAANLGQLKQLFPEHVVEGVVIPFGVFKDHMCQQIPGKDHDYWFELTKIFDEEYQMYIDGKSRSEVEKVTLGKLKKLQDLIVEMPLKKEFVRNLESNFRSVLGKEIGKIPVFLRSDTNMEDLPEFTGAGLNLTLFNVVDREQILKGIKRVWASPYTERSYQWRQQYLLNPEEVYPSILIIPSVNVDKSGVVITKGVNRGNDDAISISFSRGVGGAVEGQSAESYVIYGGGYKEMISPGRETKYRVIPPSGGSTFMTSDLNTPVLTDSDIDKLVNMANKIESKMDSITGGKQAYDIELGIKDGFIWLFQVRPFVENKLSLEADYLKAMDPELEDVLISVDE